MKKTALLHPALSRLIASLGHGDMVLIADAGMPAPRNGPNGPNGPNGSVEIIDLALTAGVPSLSITLATLLSEMQVESHIVADETLARADPWVAGLDPSSVGERRTVSHAELKALSTHARAFVRTGECTPYANIMLVSGVTF